MSWRIHSRLINPKSKNFPWDSHASLPTVLNLKKNLFRIFYSPRNKNKSYVSYFDIDMKKFEKSENCIINFSKKPILMPGHTGDDTGIMPSQAKFCGDKVLITTCCWQKTYFYPYSQKIYCFEFDSKFSKILNQMELDNKYDCEYYRTNPFDYTDEKFVIKSWVSGIKWVKKNNDFSSIYTIKMELYDKKNDKYSFYKLPLGKFCAICRPLIYKENEKNFILYFSARKRKNDYKIYSLNFYPNKFFSPPELILSPNIEKKWCNIMVEYPFVFNFNKKKYMLFCGNEFGGTGIGIAVYDSN